VTVSDASVAGPMVAGPMAAGPMAAGPVGEPAGGALVPSDGPCPYPGQRHRVQGQAGVAAGARHGLRGAAAGDCHGQVRAGNRLELTWLERGGMDHVWLDRTGHCLDAGRPRNVRGRAG
jgi:hypothetical protein